LDVLAPALPCFGLHRRSGLLSSRRIGISFGIDGRYDD